MDKYIGIVTAMAEEMLPIKERMEGRMLNIIYDLEFYEGEFKNKKYVIIKSGIGKVNAARSVQVMIDNYDLEYIINIGSAGSLNDNLNICDLVIGKVIVQYDFDITAFNHEKGYVPGIGREVYGSDELIEKYIQKIEALNNDKSQVVIGKIATGDQFCTGISLKNTVRKEFRS